MTLLSLLLCLVDVEGLVLILLMVRVCVVHPFRALGQAGVVVAQTTARRHPTRLLMLLLLVLTLRFLDNLHFPELVIEEEPSVEVLWFAYERVPPLVGVQVFGRDVPG